MLKSKEKAYKIFAKTSAMRTSSHLSAALTIIKCHRHLLLCHKSLLFICLFLTAYPIGPCSRFSVFLSTFVRFLFALPFLFFPSGVTYNNNFYNFFNSRSFCFKKTKITHDSSRMKGRTKYILHFALHSHNDDTNIFFSLCLT